MLKFDKRPAAEIIAADITTEFEAALKQFSTISEDFYRTPSLDETK